MLYQCNLILLSLSLYIYISIFVILLLNKKFQNFKLLYYSIYHFRLKLLVHVNSNFNEQKIVTLFSFLRAQDVELISFSHENVKLMATQHLLLTCLFLYIFLCCVGLVFNWAIGHSLHHKCSFWGVGLGWIHHDIHYNLEFSYMSFSRMHLHLKKT